MSSKMLYLDVDGVLLGKKNPKSHETCLANHAKEFLEYATKHFDCYWLTTHCKEGDASSVIRVLRTYCDEDVLQLLKKIRPTTWNTLKTEVIDLVSDFYWVDDSPLQFEIDYLEKNGCLDRWIDVNTCQRPDSLKEAIDCLANQAKRYEEKR